MKLVDKDGVLLDMNTAGLALIEADSWEEARGANVFDIIAPEHHEAFEEFNQRVFAGAKSRLIFEINAMKGSRRWMDSTAVPLELPNGKVVHLAITRDITAEKVAAEELAASKRQVEALNESLTESHELTDAILESAPDGVLLVSPDGSIQRANKAAVGLFGWTHKEIAELNVRQLIVQRELADGWLSLSGDQACRGERFLALHSNGEQFSAELSASRVGAFGATLFTWIVRDVSERERLESQLVTARKLESIGRLSAGLSHEISTPIQFINSNIAYLKGQIESFDLVEQVRAAIASDAPDSEKLNELRAVFDTDWSNFSGPNAKSALEDCSLGSERVMQIVRAMRAYTHPSDADFHNHDVNQLLRDALVLTRSRMSACAQIVERLCDDASICCNASAINQVVVNLLINAADAIETRLQMQDSHDVGMITVETQRVDRGLKIRLTDTGCGMSDSVIQKAFEPFFTTKELGKGTGQGLAIVYNAIVATHGGTIDIESAVNRGTTFHIFLPNGPQKTSESDGPEGTLSETAVCAAGAD